MATQRLAELLEHRYEVQRINTSPPENEWVAAEVRFRVNRVWHYFRLRRHIREALHRAPNAPVLWASISPARLGHWRDLLTVLPTAAPRQPLYAVIHRSTFDSLFHSPLTAPTARWLVRHVRGFVFLNTQLAERCAPWVPDRQRFVIPNTIDDAVVCTDDEVAAKQATRASRSPLRLLFLSNMMLEKGYLDVLEAVRLLHERGLALHADFAGRWVSDADRIAFEHLVEQYHLGTVVHHHGGVRERTRIKQLYMDADVFLLPSYHPTEAQPLTIIEALSAGTPVVVARHSGIPDMVRENQDALFVPPQAPEAIAEAVHRLADYDTWRPFSQHARQQFQNRFSPDAVRRQWVDLLEKGGKGERERG